MLCEPPHLVLEVPRPRLNIFHHHLVAWDGGRAGGEAEVPHEVPHPGGVQLNIPRVARPSTGRLAVDARDARQ